MEVVMSLAGRSVVVIGAGAGIGEATAVAYGKQGALVLVADIDGDAAQDTAAVIQTGGGTAQAHRMDFRRRSDVFGTIAAAVDRFGRLDVLANVGAIYPAVSFEEMTEELWDDVFAVDLKGPMFACQAALPHMKESGGVIINVASGAAFHGLPGLAAYSAAKAGLVALTRVVALEGGRNVRVNTVVPGPTATQGMQHDIPQIANPLLGRRLEPVEIADVIVWVSSDAAAVVNGALVRVDGGFMML
jgi:NAD(P)-dependent dehydrogenase (short-subunit alcohol dehydrogenase family)